ncbi:hypothetical protein LTR17_015616 [Elasticomyces elasticus]|nr:hypothetical protein LTR17_015616 [Elasticomyces elasticus]
MCRIVRPHPKREDTKEAMQEHVVPNLQSATHVSNCSGSNHKHFSNWILPPGTENTKAVLDSIPPPQIVLYVLDQIRNGNAAMAKALEVGLKERSESSARVYHDEKPTPGVKTEGAASVPQNDSPSRPSDQDSSLPHHSAATGAETSSKKKKKTHRGGKNVRRKRLGAAAGAVGGAEINGDGDKEEPHHQIW